MSRPTKEGLDWFKHDIDLSMDPKIRVMEQRHGAYGYIFYLKILEQIYRTKNGELKIKNGTEEDDILLTMMSSMVHTDCDNFKKILDTALKIGLLDKKLYESEGILTSQGIKKRFTNVVDCREKDRHRKGVDKKEENGVFQVDNRVFQAENTELEEFSARKVHRVEESREDKSKDKNNINSFEDLKNSYVLEEECEKENEKKVNGKKFKKPTVQEIAEYCKERKNKIEAHLFFDHYESKGWVVGKVPMKDWKAAVRTWEQNENKFPVNGNYQSNISKTVPSYVVPLNRLGYKNGQICQDNTPGL